MAYPQRYSAQEIDKLAEATATVIKQAISKMSGNVPLTTRLKQLQKQLAKEHFDFREAMWKGRKGHMERTGTHILTLAAQVEEILKPPGRLDIRLETGWK